MDEVAVAKTVVHGDVNKRSPRTKWEATKAM